MPKRYIFWPEDRVFSLKDFLDQLHTAGLDPEKTEVRIDVDQEKDGFISGVKFHCEERQ